MARFTVAVVILLLALAVQARPAEAKYASFVMDADTGEVLHAVNADTRNYPASLTKMMTLYKVFEALESGRWSMNTRLRMSRRAAGQPPSKIGLPAGKTISVRDAILALAIKSANDVAAAVADPAWTDGFRLERRRLARLAREARAETRASSAAI